MWTEQWIQTVQDSRDSQVNPVIKLNQTLPWERWSESLGLYPVYWNIKYNKKKYILIWPLVLSISCMSYFLRLFYMLTIRLIRSLRLLIKSMWCECGSKFCSPNVVALTISFFIFFTWSDMDGHVLRLFIWFVCVWTWCCIQTGTAKFLSKACQSKWVTKSMLSHVMCKRLCLHHEY